MSAFVQKLNSVNKARRGYRRYIPVGATLALGLGLSILVSALVWDWENRRVFLEFQQQADTLTTALQRGVNDNIEVFQSLSAFYKASDKIDRKSFQEFVQPALSRHSAIYGLNWLPRVTASDRAAYEKAVAAEGFPNFQIYDLAADGKPTRAAQRQEYFPIGYLEPLSERRKALGFDIASDPPRQAALDKARNIGAVVASERITLVNNNQPGFQMFLPVYSKGNTSDMPTRPQNLQGFVSAAFQITDIVKSAIKGQKLDNIDFYLYDNSATGKKRFLVRYDSNTQQLIDDPNKELPVQVDAAGECKKLSNQEGVASTCRRTFKVADRQWMLLILPTSAYAGIAIHQGGLGILTIGLLVTGSVVIYLFMSLERTAEIQHQVQERTSELQERTTELEVALERERDQHERIQLVLQQMDELKASSRVTAEQASAAATEAHAALSLASGGTDAVGQTLEGMRKLKETVEAIAAEISLLKTQAYQIGNISGLVSDLANQTNMLALNAAVEAVRAGEKGKGFGVVAAEIRKLADESKKSAHRIHTLVSEIQTAIDSTAKVTSQGTKTVEVGVKISQETAGAFTGVSDAVNNVVLNNQQILLTAQQQASAIQRVVDAINNLKKEWE